MSSRTASKSQDHPGLLSKTMSQKQNKPVHSYEQGSGFFFIVIYSFKHQNNTKSGFLVNLL